MSLYNTVMGFDPLARLVLSILKIANSETVPRFRDAYVDVRGEPPVLVILTRTGGGSRPDYLEENERLRTEVPGFLDDRDDGFDTTFAHFRYSVPDEYLELVRDAVQQGRDAGWEFDLPMDRMRKMLENSQ